MLFDYAYLVCIISYEVEYLVLIKRGYVSEDMPFLAKSLKLTWHDGGLPNGSPWD